MNKIVAKALAASIEKYASIENTSSSAMLQGLSEVFEKEANFMDKVADFDEVFDSNPRFEGLREPLFDLLMVNFFTSDVNRLEEDYLESPEWAKIEDDTVDRGTELLNLLLYINECHDEKIKPELDDFLKEFLLVEDDEFQDEYHIYESLIENQQLAESSVQDICENAKIVNLNDELADLFTPVLCFFLQPKFTPDIVNEIEKYSNQKANDCAIYSLLTHFNQSR
jgi:hypothetical protein